MEKPRVAHRGPGLRVRHMAEASRGGSSRADCLSCRWPATTRSAAAPRSRSRRTAPPPRDRRAVTHQAARGPPRHRPPSTNVCPPHVPHARDLPSASDPVVHEVAARGNVTFCLIPPAVRPKVLAAKPWHDLAGAHTAAMTGDRPHRPDDAQPAGGTSVRRRRSGRPRQRPPPRRDPLGLTPQFHTIAPARHHGFIVVRRHVGQLARPHAACPTGASPSVP